MVVDRKESLLLVLLMINKLEGVMLSIILALNEVNLAIASSSNLLYYIVVKSWVIHFE